MQVQEAGQPPETRAVGLRTVWHSKERLLLLFPWPPLLPCQAFALLLSLALNTGPSHQHQPTCGLSPLNLNLLGALIPSGPSLPVLSRTS